MVVTVPFKSYSRLLEDVLKVVSRIFITFLPPFPLMKGGNKKIQFPPINKGRVRVGSKIFDTSIITFQTPF
jgi:hypothetical protein